MLRSLGVLASALFLFACVDLNTTGSGSGSSSSSSSGGTTTATDGGTALSALDVQGFCARLVNDCGAATDLQSCVATYLPVRVTTTCKSLIASAACADLLNTSSTVSATCFPACTGTLATCNGNGTITVCTDTGLTNVQDCSAACTSQGASEWSGICGTSYNGQISDRDQCWCK